MTEKPKQKRKNIRYRDWDYSTPAAYFVTICVKNMQSEFGRINNEKMLLNNVGEIVQQEWFETAKIRPYVELNEFIVMPNHFHGIIILNDQTASSGLIHQTNHLIHQTKQSNPKPRTDNPPAFVKNSDSRGLINQTPTDKQWILMKNPKLTLGKIIRGFKARTSRKIRLKYYPDFKWQRNYYDRIIRNELEYHKIQEYIANNPLYWDWDKNNPDPINRDNYTSWQSVNPGYHGTDKINKLKIKGVVV